MPISLGELATQFGCELIGDPDTVVNSVASLPNAGPADLTFISNPVYKKQLSSTRAAVVILRPEDAAAAPVAVMVHDDPYACYARMANVICPPPEYAPFVHSSAVVDATATVSDSAHLAACVVVGERSRIGERVYVGPGTVIGPDCVIDDDCRFIANVTVVRDVTIGARCIFHPGAVLGADGFGNATTPEGWVKIPQLGGLRIGSDVEIGANSTIDCGALDDTILGDGVRIDNLCMVGHNSQVGAHTAMACQTAIAGSVIIGERCMFAGRSGAVGHITIGDDITVAGQSFLSKDTPEPGTYAGSFPAVAARTWAKQLARFRRIGALTDRVSKLEKDGD